MCPEGSETTLGSVDSRALTVGVLMVKSVGLRRDSAGAVDPFAERAPFAGVLFVASLLVAILVRLDAESEAAISVTGALIAGVEDLFAIV